MDDKKNFYTNEDAYKLLEIINSWINNSDNKISFALSFGAVLLGYILSNGMPKAFNKFLNITKLSELNGGDMISAILVIALYIFSLTSIIYLLLALKAKIKNVFIKDSNFFFGNIANKSIDQFKNNINSLTKYDIKEEIIEQIYVNSKICNKKFENYNKGLNFLLLTIILCFVCIIFKFL